ncbi:hypothetical protein GCM10011378_16120 [Hymenobacter glacieicola]|uniref:Uncharacterized protein n=1 Tax=Hymenobacter glacieicola TaxID=1562124 RepID=A0ABQ1WP73_9BACT|nr:hypothetical protein GCM10011378_16120 [Hymenobacter glacieicola]
MRAVSNAAAISGGYEELRLVVTWGESVKGNLSGTTPGKNPAIEHELKQHTTLRSEVCISRSGLHASGQQQEQRSTE